MEDPSSQAPPFPHLDSGQHQTPTAPGEHSTGFNRDVSPLRASTGLDYVAEDREKSLPRGATAGASVALPNLGQSDLDPLMEGQTRYERSTRLIPHAVRNLASSLRSRSQEPPKPEYNPDPMPYQPKLFKSSTHLKMVPVSRRHQDMYTQKSMSQGIITLHQPGPAHKALIIHSDRYQLRSTDWEDMKPPYTSLPLSARLIGQRICVPVSPTPRLTQRERMSVEQDYLDKVRSAKKDRELPSHRETRDMVMGSRRMEFQESGVTGVRLPVLAEALQPVRGSRSLLMGGQKATFTQRYDIKDELRRLKSIILPANARELFHGKGIKLPVTHAALRPRMKMPPTITPRGGASNQTPLPTIHKLFDVDSGAEDKESVTPIDDANLKTKMAPNPLQGEADLSEYNLNRDDLQSSFNRLDSPPSGRLGYEQLKPSLPENLNANQEKYVKQVYDVTSESVPFGLQEFFNLQCLCCEIEMLGEEIIQAYEKLEFISLREKLIQYLELFQSIDRLNSGKIKSESLDEILALQMQLDIEEDKPTLLTIQKPIKANKAAEITRIKYVAHIPYFIQKEKSSPFTDDEDGADEDEGEGEDRPFLSTLQNIPVAPT